MAEKFDAIIIGFGKGGKTLAGTLASKGEKVALIEKSSEMYGGTCINKACIPTKTLENLAEDVRKAKHLTFDEKKTLYREAVEKKDTLTGALRMANFNKLNSMENVTILTGKASFEGPKDVKVEMADGTIRELSGEKIFINTGTVPNVPPISGADDKSIVYTSDTLMELKDLPESITIVGAGFIGLEFAGIYNSFGSKVTIVDMGDRILPNEDEDDAEEIASILKNRGVDILNNVSIKEIREVDGEADLIYTEKGIEKEISLKSTIVLIAAGRKAKTQALNLEKAGVATDKRGFIEVNDRLETTGKDIWAIGDVNGGPQFTYISLDDYRIIMDDLFGDKKRNTKDRKNVPKVVFLDPPFARVGMNVKEAKEAGYEIMVAKMPVSAIPRAKQIGKTEGFLKVVIDKKSNKILGASLIAEDSSEIIHLLQLAIDMELPYTYLRDRIYAHPTMTEALNELFTPAMIQAL